MLHPLPTLPAAVVLALVILAGCDVPGLDVDREPLASASVVRPVLTPIDVGTDALIQAFSEGDDGAIWAGAHQGTWLRSTDGGASWEVGVVEGHEDLQFRNLAAFDANTAVLVSAGTGDASRIFRTEDGGATWTETFVLQDPEGFLSCAAFVDRDRGIVFGDTFDGSLYVLRTIDGGRTWSRLPAEGLPQPVGGSGEAEGAFAASGTCAVSGGGETLHVVTGNADPSRLLTSDDAGATWRAVDLPVDGGASRGGATLAHRADGTMFAMGGTIGRGAQDLRAARSLDGGSTWRAHDRLSFDGPAYGSAFVPGGAGVVAAGPDGLLYSPDLGDSWRRVSDDTYWAVFFPTSGPGFAGGPGGRLARIEFESTEVRAEPGDLLVTGGRWWPASGLAASANPGILVRDGEILAIGIAAPSNTRGIEHLELPDDATVLPGLFDMHAHYAVDLLGDARVDETRVNPVLFLANGVTSTFPAGEVDPPVWDTAIAMIESGELPGPRIHRSGAYFGSARPGWRNDAMTPDSIRAEVDYWAGRGVAGFKAKGIRYEQFEALVEQATTHGLTVTGHLESGRGSTVNPRAALEMGAKRIEHFLGGDALPDTTSAYASLEDLDVDDPDTRALLLEQIDRFRTNRAFFDATLTAYEYFGNQEPEVFEDFADERSFLTPYAREVTGERLPREPSEQFAKIYRVKHETLKLFVDNGGERWLTTGTDHPSWGQFFSGFGIHREMHAMTRAGVPNEVVLTAATINGARALNVDDRLGSIQEGKLADFTIVRGDPLSDITATRDVLHVVKGGEVHDPTALLDSVRGTMGPASEADADWWRGNVRLGR
jgi:imidazolonepropionase-like amidohydrolase/photosystem II stability/assembly factor-like uncharacterized protein